jgi:hypothetical protein
MGHCSDANRRVGNAATGSETGQRKLGLDAESVGDVRGHGAFQTSYDSTEPLVSASVGDPEIALVISSSVPYVVRPGTTYGFLEPAKRSDGG